MAEKFQFAKKGTGDFRGSYGFKAAQDEAARRLNGRDGYVSQGELTGPHRDNEALRKRIRQLSLKMDVGEKFSVTPLTQKEKPGFGAFTLRKIETVPEVVDSPGTPPIDAIRTYVLRRYSNAFGPAEVRDYGVYDNGICVNKPGEHGECNAWDFGVKGLTSEQIHQRLLEIAEDIRQQGKAYFGQEPGGLPVLGIIVMYQCCEAQNLDWRPYSGIGHVSHVHVSGYPSQTGWF